MKYLGDFDMKNFGFYILGIITGVVLTPFILGIINGYEKAVDEYDNPYGIRGLKMLKQKGECVTSNNLEIFQTLTSGIALAHPTGNYNVFVLLIDETERLFYDGEKVKNPTNHCAKQIGTYTYETKAEVQKTVPAVIIEKN